MNGGQRNGMNVQIWGSKTTQIMMATVPHVTSGLGLRKFQVDGFLLTRVYMLYWKEQDMMQFRYLSKYSRIPYIAPVGLNRCQIIIHSGSIFWLKFLQVIFCYSPQRMWTFSYFHFIIKILKLFQLPQAK